MNTPADSIIFLGPVTSTFNAVSVRSDENPFTCQCKKEKEKRLKVFKCCTFIGGFEVTPWQ